MRNIILVTAVLSICIKEIKCQEVFQSIVKLQLQKFWETGRLPTAFKHIVKSLDIAEALQRGIRSEEWSNEMTKTFCSLCATATDEVYKYYQDPNITKETFFNRLHTVCSLIGGDELCDNAFEKYKPIFTYIFDNSNTTGNDICGMVFMQFGCRSNHTKREWKIDIPNKEKPPIQRTLYPQISEVPTNKILLLTDIHYDRKYKTGSNAACDDVPLCCREQSRGNRTEGDEAGYWGDYRLCDIPKRTLELLLKDASERHPDIDLIISLGDHIAHDISNVSRREVLAAIEETFDLIEQYFPGKLLLPVIGNHDVDPVNSFAPPYIEEPALSTSWLYGELADIWQKWLPSDVSQTFIHGGYYATTIKPGLKAIALNSNYCYAHNWWLILDSNDVGGNLQFLVNELQKIEDEGEKVYILSHMSPGSKECDYTWSREYNKILNRYENVIAGLFYGHSHNDFFEIYFDSQDTARPYAVGHTVPSVTTYIGLNPGYKIHIVEGDFPESKFRVLDGESYILDLKKANLLPHEESNEKVTKLYSTLEDYQLLDMSPESMLILVKCMTLEGNSLFEKFFTNFHKNGSNINEKCDAQCHEVILCNSLSSDVSNPIHCNILKSPITELSMRSSDEPVRCGEICYKNCDNELLKSNKKEDSESAFNTDIKLTDGEDIKANNVSYNNTNEVYIANDDVITKKKENSDNTVESIVKLSDNAKDENVSESETLKKSTLDKKPIDKLSKRPIQETDTKNSVHVINNEINNVIDVNGLPKHDENTNLMFISEKNKNDVTGSNVESSANSSLYSGFVTTVIVWYLIHCLQ